MQLERLCQWKIPVTPAGIEPATFQLVAQRLNHCATAIPQTGQVPAPISHRNLKKKMNYHGLSIKEENKSEITNFVNISERSENVMETLKNGCRVMRKPGFQYDRFKYFRLYHRTNRRRREWEVGGT